MTSPNAVQQRFLNKLPDVWFREGKQPGGNVHALAMMIGSQLADFIQNIEALDIAIQLGTAEGLDLDRQGLDLGVPRQETIIQVGVAPGTDPVDQDVVVIPESDHAYRARIVASMVKAKLTKPAIEAAVSDATGATCEVIEPWHDAMRLGTNATLGSTYLGGGPIYTEGTIIVRSEGGYDVTRLVVEETRAAGIKAFYQFEATDGVDGAAYTLAPAMFSDALLTVADSLTLFGRTFKLGDSKLGGDDRLTEWVPFIGSGEVQIGLAQRQVMAGSFTDGNVGEGSVYEPTEEMEAFRFDHPGRVMDYTTFQDD